MDVYDETKAPLQTFWDDELKRQDAKIVILKAIGDTSDISVKVANDILDEMDRMLLKEDEETKPKLDKAL